MGNLRYIACKDCLGPVRIDDGSYQNQHGEVCQHYGARVLQRNCESNMTIFRSPDGQVSIPWEPDTPCPKGYIKEEVRGARAVRRLERELDARDIQRHHNWLRKRDHLFNRSQRREDLKQIARDGVYTVTDKDGCKHTKHVSEFGRSMARQALRKMDGGYSERYDPGNFRRE
jgi:hypothetical protein